MMSATSSRGGTRDPSSSGPRHVIPTDAGVGRAAAYELLSRFFRLGLTVDLLEQLRGLPGIGDLLPASVDADRQAADHYGLLGMEVFPLASAYLEEDGRSGGATSDYVTRLAVRAGDGLVSAEPADHVSRELDILARLCRIHAGSPESPDLRVEAVSGQRQLLDHLFWWFPAFVFGLSGQGNALYTHMADWTMALVVDHFHALPFEDEPEYAPLPVQPGILDDGSTGLRQIAEYLSRPAVCGIVLTRRDIQELARDLRVPRGFGDRALMLTNLMGAAGTYDRTEDLVGRLRAIVADWTSYFGRLEDPDGPRPLLRAAGAWRDRAEKTGRMLQEMLRRLAGDE